MDKLPMCRICLVENVNMYVVVNKNLHELYEKLTDIPFVTKDSRPILACFFCCAKLKQCFRLLRKCLEAEELFAQMMNDDYEPLLSISQDHLHHCTGFIKSPIVHVSVVDECGTDSIAIKEELPAVCDRRDDVVEQKEEYQTDDLDLGIEDIPPQLSESDSGGDVKMEVEQELSKKKRRAVEINRLKGLVDECGTDSIAIKEELPAVCDRRDDVIEQKEEYQTDDLELENLNNTCLGLEDIPPQLSESDLGGDLEMEVEQEQGLSNKKRRAVETNRAPVSKKPKLDTRRTRLEDKITVGLKKNEQSNLEFIRTTKNCTLKHGPSVKESYKCDQRSSNRVKKIKQNTRTGICEKLSHCDVCQRSFKRKGHLIEHIRMHTGEKPYQCDVCQRSFRQLGTLTTHIRMHTGENPYKCDVCERSFRQKVSLTAHIRMHTGEKPYKCDVCERSFSRKDKLTAHIRMHTGEKPYKCDVCQRCFTQKGSLTVHSKMHTGEKPYKCDVCERSFSRKDELTEHIWMHTGEKPYKCDVCHRSFSRKSNLTVHILKHTGKKPYKCDVCERSFRQKSNLTAHIRMHSGEKPYKCDVCQRSFSQNSSLTQHFRMHTGEQPYKCDVCQRCFSRKICLTEHIRVHTGEKPYKCGVCQRSFSQRSCLTVHTRIHTRMHSGEKP